MCGIAGYSLSESSGIDPFDAARVLIASVSERGADSAGCAYVDGDAISVFKQPGGASQFLETFELPAGVRQILLHVRDFTKGRPSLMANNHPIKHHSIVGVHNGRIENDEQVFTALGVERAEAGMTVDSEAIFASLHHGSSIVAALETLRGSLACGWIDAERPESIYLARGYGRPLWLARPDEHSILWASTIEAIEIAEELLGLRLHKRPVRPGTVLEISGGSIVSEQRFRPDHTASWLMNPIASPAERIACLRRLERSA